jgi:hypothetical protein
MAAFPLNDRQFRSCAEDVRTSNRNRARGVHGKHENVISGEAVVPVACAVSSLATLESHASDIFCP